MDCWKKNSERTKERADEPVGKAWQHACVGDNDWPFVPVTCYTMKTARREITRNDERHHISPLAWTLHPLRCFAPGRHILGLSVFIVVHNFIMVNIQGRNVWEEKRPNSNMRWVADGRQRWTKNEEGEGGRKGKGDKCRKMPKWSESQQAKTQKNHS